MLRVFIYIILLSGFGNTVLRPEIENPFTLYRLLAPLGLVAIFCYRPMFVMKWTGGFAIFALYSWALAASYSDDFSQFLPSLVHYWYLFVLLLMMVLLKNRYVDFEKSFMRFFTGFYAFLWASLALELMFGLVYPNLLELRDYERAIRAIYWSENDLAVVMCAFAWIIMTDDRYRNLERVALVLLTFALLFYNDSKAALISMVLSVCIATIFEINKKIRVSVGLWVAASAVACAIALLPVIAILNEPLAFATGDYSLADLFYEPIRRILTLETTGEFWGSLNNRTDAAINVLIEYLKSFGLGLGPGGSWLVLTLPQYELGGAKSPHNALLQFTVDFGLPVLLGYAYLFFWAVRRVFRSGLDYPTRVKVMGILSFPLLGLSQSGAIVTNYAFFTLAIFIALIGKERHAAKSRTVAVVQQAA